MTAIMTIQLTLMLGFTRAGPAALRSMMFLGIVIVTEFQMGLAGLITLMHIYARSEGLCCENHGHQNQYQAFTHFQTQV